MKSFLQFQVQQQVERLKAALQLDAQRQVELLKAQLQLDSQRSVEHLRSELTSRNDAIRHEMAKHMLRAQLSTTKTHEVYSDLIRLTVESEGAVFHLLGGSYGPTYQAHNVSDIQELLSKANTPGEEIDEIIGLWDRERSQAIRRLKEILRRHTVYEARDKLTEARNHIIRWGVFMTRPVRDLAFKINLELGEAWSAVRTLEEAPGTPGLFETHQKCCAQAKKDVEQLEEVMRSDLMPSLIFTGPWASGPDTPSLQPSSSPRPEISSGAAPSPNSDRPAS